MVVKSRDIQRAIYTLYNTDNLVIRFDVQQKMPVKSIRLTSTRGSNKIISDRLLQLPSADKSIWVDGRKKVSEEVILRKGKALGKEAWTSFFFCTTFLLER